MLVEPTPALPPAEEHGKASDGVLALRQPVTNEQVAELVHRYMHAYVEERVIERATIEELLERDAVLLGDQNKSAPRVNITQLVDQRVIQHAKEYRDKGDLSHADKLVRWGYDDIGPRTDPPRPTEMREGDVYVRVPVDPVLSIQGDPLFRATLILVIRRSVDHKLRFIAVGESDMP